MKSGNTSVEDYLGLWGQFINRNVANEGRRLVLDEVDGGLFLVCHSWSDTRWESRMNIVVQTLTSLYFDTSDGSFATWHQWGYYRWEINPSLRALRTWTGFIPS